MKPLISVIIDTYNYGCFIEEAIDSVLNQDFPSHVMEVIVVDDGSTDDTRERIKKYGDKINYIYKDNKGQASAFNTGFKYAKGEIITFLDSDDYWHPLKLKYILEEFESSKPVDFVYHNLNIVCDNQDIIKTYSSLNPFLSYNSKTYGKEESINKKMSLKNYLSGIILPFPPTSGISARAAILKHIFPIPQDYRVCADTYIHFFLPFYAESYSLVRTALGSYRIHGNNLFSCYEKSQRLNQLIYYFSILTGDLKNYEENSGNNTSLLRKEIMLWIKNWRKELKGKKVRFKNLRSTIKTHHIILRKEGIKTYISLSYRYRKDQLTKILENFLSKPSL